MSALTVEGLTKRFGDRPALDGVGFSVEPGELFAYLGPNGSGKTTTIRILTRLTRPSAGRVLLDGCDLFCEGPAAVRRVGLVPQTVNLDRDLSVRDNLDLHGRFFGVPAARRREKIAELLAYAGLEERAESLVKELSGGLQRRVLIIRALIHEPRILLLDEPSIGLDPAIRRQLWALIKRIQKSGTTIFMTTHYIEEAELLADRVAFLCEGRLAAIDTPAGFIAAIGRWAVDHADGEGLASSYFNDRRAAIAAAQAGEEGFRLRAVNLEDAFLQLTGKRVLP